MQNAPVKLNNREWLSMGTGLMGKSTDQQCHGNCGHIQRGREKQGFLKVKWGEHINCFKVKRTLTIVGIDVSSMMDNVPGNCLCPVTQVPRYSL